MTPDRQTLVSPGLVAPPVLVALLAEVAAWALALRPGVLGPGFWYGRGDLLAAVHLVTVGTLALAITGTGWQLVPVVAAQAPSPRWAAVARLVNGAVILGLVLLVAGFLRHGPWLLGGAALLVGGLLLRSSAVVSALVRASGRRAVRGWLLAAEASLVAGLVLAGILAAERAGAVPLVLPDRIAGIGLHAALLLGGWVGGWMVGLGSLLLPMFAVAPEPRPPVLAVAGALWFGGLSLQQPVLWALGALLAALALLHSLARRVRRQVEPGLVGAAVALGSLFFLALGLLLGPEPAPFVAAALLLWALPFLRGVALRILPFLTWVHAVGDQGASAPPVAALVPARLPALAVASGLMAGLAVLSGQLLARPELSSGGAVLGLLGALAAALLFLLSAFRAWRLRQRTHALPGMEAP